VIVAMSFTASQHKRSRRDHETAGGDPKPREGPARGLLEEERVARARGDWIAGGGHLEVWWRPTPLPCMTNFDLLGLPERFVTSPPFRHTHPPFDRWCRLDWTGSARKTNHGRIRRLGNFFRGNRGGINYRARKATLCSKVRFHDAPAGHWPASVTMSKIVFVGPERSATVGNGRTAARKTGVRHALWHVQCGRGF